MNQVHQSQNIRRLALMFLNQTKINIKIKIVLLKYF